METITGSNPVLTTKEVLRWASSSIKKQSLHHSQVAELVRRNQWGSNQQQLVYTGSNPVLTTQMRKALRQGYIDWNVCRKTKNSLLMGFERDAKRP